MSKQVLTLQAQVVSTRSGAQLQVKAPDGSIVSDAKPYTWKLTSSDKVQVVLLDDNVNGYRAYVAEVPDGFDGSSGLLAWRRRDAKDGSKSPGIMPPSQLVEMRFVAIAVGREKGDILCADPIIKVKPI